MATKTDTTEVKTPEESKRETKQEPKKKLTAKGIDVHQYITVRSGFHGKLVYKSTKTGERFEWNEYGAEQEMELQELRNAKNVSKKYFQNNWFMFDDDWVIDYLGLRGLYRYALPVDRFDEVFDKNDEDMKKFIGAMSDGQKKNVAFRANELIKDGTIDSRRKIATLEEALGIELVVH